MNIFTQHTQQQGVTYTEHMIFAMGIAIRLLNSVIAFALHAIFPFIDIKQSLDLEETGKFLREKNVWIERMKRHSQSASLQISIQQDKRVFESNLLNG